MWMSFSKELLLIMYLPVYNKHKMKGNLRYITLKLFCLKSSYLVKSVFITHEKAEFKSFKMVLLVKYD